MQPIVIENLSKSYGMKTLFKDTNFTINENDKVGIIGINGTGKSTLLRLVAGHESPDAGEVSVHKNTTIEFLTQQQDFKGNLTVIEQVLQGDSEVFKVLRAYESALELSEKEPENTAHMDTVLKYSEEMTRLNAWELESQVKTILTKLSIHDFAQPVAELSGGQKKRLALAASLITPCELLIMDEPTNHMDNETIDWLEDYLAARKGALLMITHDRYFLDRVTNKILEIDHGNVYTYEGNYTAFLQKKAERVELAKTLEQKRQNLYKRELAWIQRGARARSTKQKAHIRRFEEVKNSTFVRNDQEVAIDVGFTRLGKKTIELNHISKAYDENVLFKDFSYTVLKDDRIGIIGDNGVGKTTLLNSIVGQVPLTSGDVEIGDTVKIGYFSQESEDMPENMKAIDFIKETAEYIRAENGHQLSASSMMERFLFDDELQYAPIHSMSGGEKRRLYLLRTLMTSPNVLILDEPTNDLDIDTLKILEAYIDDFKGIVITVSHDRYFLDRICNKMLSFEQGGRIITFTGNYSEYHNYLKEHVTLEPDKDVSTNQAITKEKSVKVKTKQIRMTYQEKKDYETIESEIEALESKLETVDSAMSECQSDFVKLQELSNEKEQLEETIIEKMTYFEYLEDLNSKIQGI